MMGKGNNKRGNKEAKKPKQEKAKPLKYPDCYCSMEYTDVQSSERQNQRGHTDMVNASCL